jgi:ribosomal protein S6
MIYELFYLIGTGLEQDLPKIKEDVEKIVTGKEGKFLEKETVEKRRLSYKIGRDTHGIYIARRFELENSENVREISNKLNLDNRVSRFIISRADELPELSSKAERMAQAQRKTRELPRIQPVVEKNKEVKKESSEEKTEDKKEVKDVKGEDIDKKLEEILNI